MIANGSAYLGFPLFAGSGTKSEPPEAKRSIGMLPSDTFPAEWANYLFYRSSENIGRLCTDTNSIKKELNSILEAYGITNDASAYDQLLTALNKIYPKITNCVTPASTQEKSLAIADNVLHVGDIYAVTFTYGNTYGDGSTTYPTLSINNGTAYPICNADGSYAGNGSWSANNTIQFLYTGTKFIMSNSIMTDRVERGLQQAVTSNAVSCIIAANNSFNGPALGSGGQIRVMFTADIAGADTTSAMGVVYNGNAVLVKVCKDGALVNFTAKEVATNTYKYLQAYTTLDLVYDGTNFVIVGNPVVLSSSNYTIYASGQNGYELNKTIPDVKLFSNYYCRIPPAYVANTKYTFTATEDCFIRISQSWSDSTNTGKTIELFSSNDISLIQIKYAGYGGSSITSTNDNGATLKSNWLFVRKGESVKYAYYGYDREIINPRIAMLTQKQTSNPLFVNN